MPKCLIKVSQPAEVASERIATSIRLIGSHFATHASWQQKNGIATGTMVVEVDDQAWAQSVVLPNMRSCAKIVRLDAPVTRAETAPAILDRAQIPYPLAA
jgi:hypothetical protein